MSFNMIITGIGGQGVVSAANIIAEAALRSGLKVRNSDATGLAQRGGSVHSQIKIGSNVKSAILHPGTVDVILGFEPLEASRYAHMLKPDGLAIINNNPVYPVTVKNGMLNYPLIDELKRIFEERNLGSIWVNALDKCIKLGDVRILNSFMIGLLTAKSKLPIDVTTLKEALKANVPKRTIELNLKAFDLGQQQGEKI
ncbi:MAG: indolepyruvate oxidoreductase subunit beta [Armatimonadetes bacterium]|nr:indolepyruvate oxidoreductase subunit beta [Armatimonadota bacterium]